VELVLAGPRYVAGGSMRLRADVAEAVALVRFFEQGAREWAR
jgi:hypothetical protein